MDSTPESLSCALDHKNWSENCPILEFERDQIRNRLESHS